MRLKELIEDTPPDLEEKFGRVLFGDWQYKNGIRPDHEKDTEYERKMFQNLSTWFYGQFMLSPVQNTMIELSKLKDNYPTLLRPDPASRFPYLYRGVSSWGAGGVFQIDKPELSDPAHDVILKPRDQSAKFIHGKEQSIRIIKTNNTITYKPKRTAESWTISINSAIDILLNHFDESRNDIVILKAKVPDEERLLKIKATNALYNEMKQFEVVRVSDRPIEAEVFQLESVNH